MVEDGGPFPVLYAVATPGGGVTSDEASSLARTLSSVARYSLEFLHLWPDRVSCALVRVEVVRAVRQHGRDAVRRAREVLDRVGLLALDDALLDAAADLSPGALRSLDAIHLAAARAFGGDLAAVVTYDLRMRDAAEALGLRVAAPA